MSVQALAWVFDHSPTRGADRLVLLSIANHAGRNVGDGAWEAWPGVALIQREAGLDRSRTVQDALRRLVDSGALQREVNGAPDERIRRDHRPNLYRIMLASGVTCGDTRCGWCGVTPNAERGDASRPNGVTFGDATGCRAASPEPLVEPSVEPEEQPTLVAVPPRLPFDAFWNLYPRRHGKRVGKADSERQWAKLGEADRALVMVAVVHYAAACDSGVTLAKDPERWLAKRELWADTWQTPAASRTNGHAARVATDRTGPSRRLAL